MSVRNRHSLVKVNINVDNHSVCVTSTGRCFPGFFSLSTSIILVDILYKFWIRKIFARNIQNSLLTSVNIWVNNRDMNACLKSGPWNTLSTHLFVIWSSDSKGIKDILNRIDVILKVAINLKKVLWMDDLHVTLIGVTYVILDLFYFFVASLKNLKEFSNEK